MVIPVLGIVTFVPAWLTAAGIKVFSFVAPLSPPYSYMGPGVAGWMVAGLIYLVYLYRHDQHRVVGSAWFTLWTRWRIRHMTDPQVIAFQAIHGPVRVDVRGGHAGGPGSATTILEVFAEDCFTRTVRGENDLVLRGCTSSVLNPADPALLG